MKTSEQINEIAEAMSKAQGQMQPADLEGSNPHFKSKYVTLASVWNAIRKPLTDNGLSVFQDVTTSERSVSVETKIVHKSGQWMEFGPLLMPVGKQDAQGFGSSITYAKRYALCASLGVVGDEDDDGNEACDVKTGEVKSSLTPKQLELLKGLCAKAGIDKIKELQEKYKVQSLSYVSPFKFNDLLSDLGLEKKENSNG